MTSSHDVPAAFEARLVIEVALGRHALCEADAEAARAADIT